MIYAVGTIGAGIPVVGLDDSVGGAKVTGRRNGRPEDTRENASDCDMALSRHGKSFVVFVSVSWVEREKNGNQAAAFV